MKVMLMLINIDPEIKFLTNMFKIIDRDMDGVISFPELKVYMK